MFACVGDFGFARRQSRGRMTLAGTEEYMAPEVTLGKDYDEKADVYGYGVVLIVLASSKDPPPRAPQAGFDFSPDVLKAAIPPDCPRMFASLIEHCVQYKPQSRPSFQEICECCEKVLEDLDRDYEMHHAEPDETLRTKKALDIMKNRLKGAHVLLSSGTQELKLSSAPSSPGHRAVLSCYTESPRAEPCLQRMHSSEILQKTENSQMNFRNTVGPSEKAKFMPWAKAGKKGEMEMQQQQSHQGQHEGYKSLTVVKKFSWRNSNLLKMRVTTKITASIGGTLSIKVEFHNSSAKAVTAIQVLLTEHRIITQNKKIRIMTKEMGNPFLYDPSPMVPLARKEKPSWSGNVEYQIPDGVEATSPTVKYQLIVEGVVERGGTKAIRAIFPLAIRP